MAKHEPKTGVEDILLDDSQAGQPPAQQTNAPARTSAAERAQKLREERASGARHRTLGGFTQRLAVYGTVPGYHLATINDDGNRIADCLAHGFEFVQADELEGVNGDVVSYNSDPGSKVRFLVGTRKDGDPMFGYLMKIPEEIWEEDQRELNERAMAPIRQMMKGGMPQMSNEELKDMSQTHERPPVSVNVSSIYSREVRNGS